MSQNVVVVAGAGTGKTHALVERYLMLLLGLDDELAEPRAPEALLAITFTEKAAAEMRARVQRRLGHLLFEPEKEQGLVERAQSLRRELRPDLLEDLRRATSGAPIFTFHAFCGRVLRDHALAAGLDPSFTILEPDDERRLLAENAEACVIDALQHGTRGSGELVAELVARVGLHGFGERKALVECLVDLHGTLAERGIDPVMIPFATAASTSLHDALHALSRACDSLRPKATTGAAAQRMVFIDEARKAVAGIVSSMIDEPEELSDPEAALSSAFGVLQNQVGGNWGGKNLADERRAVVNAVDALGAALVDSFTANLAPVVLQLLVDLDARQRREKHARGFLAFGDLLRLTRDLLRDVPAVRASVKARFARVLVDEYQDTSPVQEDLLALLLEEPSRGDRHEPDVPGTTLGRVILGEGRAFLVGDPKQSIYGFRGADAGVFTRALDVVAREPAGRRDELSVSRRSLQPIVDLANLVAQVALPRGPFGVEPSQLVPLSALRGGEGAAGEHWLVSKDEVEGGPKLTPHEQESVVVARKLRELIDAGTCKAGEVAVLVRRGKAAVPIARALGRAGISSIVVGGDGFYVRPEVADVIAALTLAADPTDELALLTVLRSPLVGVPDDQMLALYEALPDRPRGLTWPRALAAASSERAGLVDDGVRARLRAFDATLTSIKRRLHEPRPGGGPVARAIDVLLDDAGYAAACAVEPDAALRLRNLEKLRAIAERDRESGLVSVARLAAALDDPPAEPLAAVDDVTSGADAVRGSDAVRIMTIHQAKGLEFPVVVLADAGSGLKGESDDVGFDPDVGLAVTARGRPIASCAQRASRGGEKDRWQPTALQRVRRRLRERNECELARLLYVALTRARDRLYVVGEPRRQGMGSLLGVLDLVRAHDTPRFDALLPRVMVAPVPFVAPSAPTAPLEDDGLAPAAPMPRGRLRVRASELGARQRPQLGLDLAAPLFVPGPVESGSADDERMPPRAAGRLAHAVIALCATEHPEVVDDGERLAVVVASAARAVGVKDAPAELLARCAATLAGPVRALLHDGYSLSFEEPLWLEQPGVVVEGKADLVARRADRTVAVELKLTDARARGDHALLQVLGYAAALEQQGEPAPYVATWTLGDPAPPSPQAFGKALRTRLDKALALVAWGPVAPGAN